LLPLDTRHGVVDSCRGAYRPRAAGGARFSTTAGMCEHRLAKPLA